jgi:hypothetical protein
MLCLGESRLIAPEVGMEEKGDERRDASDERHWFRCERRDDEGP